jgi:HEAT repeats
LHSKGQGPAPSNSLGNLEGAQRAARRRANLAVGLVPVFVILITFLFWYQTWFGRRLSAGEMNRYLTDTSVPHKTQHALSQLANEIAKGEPEASRWYPLVQALAANKESEYRLMAAWVMGQDNKSPDFHEALRGLLKDPEPMVRRNAALGLVRFGDAAGESDLLQMLRPFELKAPVAGTLEFRLKASDEVPRGSVVAKIRPDGADPVDVNSPVDGIFERRVLPDGAKVAAGEKIAVLAPSEGQVWESLRALYLAGTEQSLPDVERFTEGVPGMSANVRQQAELTAEVIKKRSSKP